MTNEQTTIVKTFQREWERNGKGDRRFFIVDVIQPDWQQKAIFARTVQRESVQLERVTS